MLCCLWFQIKARRDFDLERVFVMLNLILWLHRSGLVITSSAAVVWLDAAVWMQPPGGWHGVAGVQHLMSSAVVVCASPGRLRFILPCSA